MFLETTCMRQMLREIYPKNMQCSGNETKRNNLHHAEKRIDDKTLGRDRCADTNN